MRTALVLSVALFLTYMAYISPALTAASLDLARRGIIAFSTEKAGLLGTTTKLSVAISPQIKRTPEDEMHVQRAQDAVTYSRRLVDLAPTDLARIVRFA